MANLIHDYLEKITFKQKIQGVAIMNTNFQNLHGLDDLKK